MKENNLKNTYFLAYGAAIAAIYVALTMAFQPISFGPVQFRISEALCILPFFTPAAIPGLFVGCFLSNLFCGAEVSSAACASVRVIGNSLLATTAITAPSSVLNR